MTQQRKRTGLLDTVSAALAQSGRSGVDTLFEQSDAPEIMVDLDDIEIVSQVRSRMEESDQTLSELGDSLVEYQIHAIFLRIMPSDHPKPYRMVSGERRFHAARLKGLTQLRAKARELTDEQAERLQLAENIHRLNLAILEEANKVKRYYDQFNGDIEAVMEATKKSRGWISKRMQLLELPEHTGRLISQGLSADVEVITGLKQVEKRDPRVAASVIEKLEAGKGAVNARELVEAAKVEVKNPASKRALKPVPDVSPSFVDGKEEKSDVPQPEAVLPVTQVLNEIYMTLKETGSSKEALRKHGLASQVYSYLRQDFDLGKKTKNLAKDIIAGVSSGHFGGTGCPAFRLAAFVEGAVSSGVFDARKLFDDFT